MMRRKTKNALLKVIWVRTQCSNRRNKLILHTSISRPEMASTAADPLVVVTDSKHATIRVLAFLDFFRCAVYSAYKRGSLEEGHEHTNGAWNAVTLHLGGRPCS